jgi:hypothetical protein
LEFQSSGEVWKVRQKECGPLSFVAIRRYAHAVYDTKYHLVCVPKYRKWIKREDVRDKADEIFWEGAENYSFEIGETKVARKAFLQVSYLRSS